MNQEDAHLIEAVMDRDRAKVEHSPGDKTSPQALFLLTNDETIAPEIEKKHWGFVAPENVLTKWEKNKDIKRFNNLLNLNILTMKMTKPYFEYDPIEEVLLTNVRMAAFRKFKRSEDGFERTMIATQKTDHTVHAPRITNSGGLKQKLLRKFGR